MERSELKICWKCGCQENVHFVNSWGCWIDDNRGLVSCFSKKDDVPCMEWNEIYNVDEWQNHPREQ